MSTSNVTDETFITDTVTTTGTASSSVVAALDIPPSPLLRLPLELQGMIWGHVIASCCPTVRQISKDTIAISKKGARRCYGFQIQRIVSTDDIKGIYSPHPLCYVSKSIFKEVRDQIYRTASFTTTPIGCQYKTALFMRIPDGCYHHKVMLPPIVRLSLSIDQAITMLIAIIPYENNSTKRPEKHLILTSATSLKYLELTWHVKKMPDCERLTLRLANIRRMLTRLRFFRRSFEVKMNMKFRHHLQAGVDNVRYEGIVTDTSTIFKYQNDLQRDSEFEQRFAHFICAGDSIEELRTLNTFVAYPSMWANRPTFLSDNPNQPVF